MATIKSFTNLEQSKKLAEILPLESADMHYWRKDQILGVGHSKEMQEGFKSKGIDYNPCWSLAALLDVLPEGIIENYYVPNLQKENGKYSIAYGDDELLCIADNPVDACVAMIEKLHELKEEKAKAHGEIKPIVVRDFNSVFSREQVEEIDKRIEESQRVYNAKLRDAMRKVEDFPMTD